MKTLTDLSYVNINKVCRICLLENENMRSVFSKLNQTEVLEENVNQIADVLTKITTVAIHEEDGLPQLICLNCVNLINTAYKFKVQFDNSYNVLKQYLSVCIKEETTVLSEYNENNKKNDFNIHDHDYNYVNPNVIQNEDRIEQEPRESKPVRTRNLTKEDNSEFFEPPRNRNEGIQYHPCPICTKEFTALELKQHAQTHKALKRYLSIPTDKKIKPGVHFYYSRYLVDYSKKVNIHTMKEKLHDCFMCNKKFSAIQLKMHLYSHRNQKEYKCDQCDRVFRKMNHLNTHRVKHLKEFPFKCEQCGKGFVIQSNYDCHMLTHNTNQELPHECSCCLRRFSNPAHLNRHMVSHRENVSYGVKYKVRKCYRCLKTFKEHIELKNHECIPVEQDANARYPCKDCDKVFKNAAGLHNHTRNIHKLKGVKTLCSVCGLHVSNIYNHMMRHSGEKPHECTQCGKRFLLKPQLRQHLLVHSGVKPYVCSVCAKAFNNLYNLQVHERIHTGIKCYVCNICNKRFLEKSYLKKHMNVHPK